MLTDAGLGKADLDALVGTAAELAVGVCESAAWRVAGLLDELLENLPTHLGTNVGTHRDQRRVLLHLVLVGGLELAEPDVHAIDLGRVVAANEREARPSNEDEGDTDEREDRDGDPAREFFADVLQHRVLRSTKVPAARAIE